MLPYIQQAKNNPDVSFHVTALSNVYVERLGQNTTQTYLNELKELASRSGENFEDVLKGMSAHIHESVVANPCPVPVSSDGDTLPAHSADQSLTEVSLKPSQTPNKCCTTSLCSTSVSHKPTIPINHRQ